ncbi:DeoR/GlpR family DNA-binding transcription regulator [Pseudomonas sp. RIT-PI-AD]|uniref:DeoR/GlpR family DNA-binding transcription regulator n=1 Tax=Pseudomonas sp. RIT-PI-AD TaxID=3035294 RepID=UPI0021D8064E|nr:DeoR/GlpR family DNA-binding transcription regulator [Pseudomonas sp. RIT-PI-AD]
MPKVSADALVPRERRDYIMERLTRQGKVLAVDLARDLGATEDTIRRDLRDLASNGQCKRIYGGALPLSPASQPLSERVDETPGRKQALARAAVTLVKPRHVLIIDAGSTNVAIAAHLPKDMPLTVVTNAPSVADALSGHDQVVLILLGGLVNKRIGAAVGVRTLRDVMSTHADLCFLGVCALDAQAGLAVFDSEEAELKKAMIEASEKVVVAATMEKLGTRAAFHIAAAQHIGCLVVEKDTEPMRLNEFSRLGIDVLKASQ